MKIYWNTTSLERFIFKYSEHLIYCNFYSSGYGVHPGYGFLAENADFAELCEACQLKFIGPSYQSIQKMGIKDVAKAEMIKANVPVVPGSDGLMKDVSEAKKIAKKIGYPVIIKATAVGEKVSVLLVMKKNLKLASE